MHFYTAEEINFIGENIKGCSYKDMTAMFNKEFGTDLSVNAISGVIKSRGFKNGRDCTFKPGEVRYRGGKGWKPTQFKKGNVPANYRPVGSERITVDGYVEIKVADPRTWRQKHVVEWERVNGPRPKGHALLFLDGDRKNCSLDNLVLVSRKKLAVLNQKGLLQKNKALNESALILADVILKTNDRKKELK